MNFASLQACAAVFASYTQKLVKLTKSLPSSSISLPLPCPSFLQTDSPPPFHKNKNIALGTINSMGDDVFGGGGRTNKFHKELSANNYYFQC